MDGESENPRDRTDVAFALSGKALFFGSFLQQAVERQPAGAAKDGCVDEASAQAIDSSGASPDTCRTGDLKNAGIGVFQHHAKASKRNEPGRAADGTHLI